MEHIETPALYDERGDVSRSRPILQGDVFRDVDLPGFEDGPKVVQIVTHPCSMRKGTALVERITVAPVEPYQLITGDQWDGHLRVMPLADLVEGRNYATKFVDVTAAPAGLLSNERRIATLTHRGIYVLQQRLIKHYTRLEVPIQVLRRESAPVLEEAEQQRDWIETVLDEDELTDESVSEAARAYDEWLSQGEPSLRTQLQEDQNHADIRRRTHQEALRRRKSE